MKERSLVQIVEKFHLLGDETAYVCRRGYRIQRWTYRQIAESAWQMAREMQFRGISSGDKVILWGENCAEWVLSFFACVLQGVIVVPLDRNCAPDFAERVCRQVKASLGLCSRGQPRIPLSLPVIILEDLPQLLMRHSCAPLPIPEIKSLDTVEIVFTSGTTADPKGVVLSHKNIITNLEPLEQEIGKYLKYERIVHPLRFLNLLPLSHVFGQFLGLFVPQILGGTVIFHDTLNPSEIIRTIKKERVSVLVTVPRILETLRDKIERDLELENSLSGFRKNFDAFRKQHFLKRWWRFRSIHRQMGWKFWAFISGGASLDSETEQFWGCLGFAVIQGYGLTETTSLISINHPLKLGKGSIGKVLPGREVKLAPDGEILVRGENVAGSYYQGQEKKMVLEEGWFHTGDMGFLDEKGSLYFKGRRKRVIVTPEGMNVYPEDLEAALRRQPEVRDCLVVGVERGGNAEPCAALILRDKTVDAKAVIQRANETLADFQNMRRWLIWPEEDFPRASTQKPQIQDVQNFVNAQMDAIGSPVSGGNLLAEIISSITGRGMDVVSKPGGLAENLNLSSIERVELLSTLEDRFQLDIDESSFSSANTMGEIENILSHPDRRSDKFRYPGWAQSSLMAVLRILGYYLLIWPATQVMAKPRIRGRENLYNLQGPLLFASNHITGIDVGFILAALPMRYRHRLAVAMIGELLQEMRNPPSEMFFLKRWQKKIAYGLVVGLFNAFPLPQTTGFRKSFSFAGESVDRGYSILVFPEGTRTRDGNLGPFRAGIGLLATNLNIPVVPMKIDGLYEVKKSGKKWAHPGIITVTMGSAVHFEPGTNPSDIAHDLETRIRLLSD